MSTSPSPPSVSVSPPPKSDRLPSPSNTKHVPWRRHTLKQLKLVLPGAALTYYLETIHVFLSMLHGTGGFWARCGYLNKCVVDLLFISFFYRTGAITASVLGLITISLFSYVLVLHWFTGQKINVRTPYRDSIATGL